MTQSVHFVRGVAGNVQLQEGVDTESEGLTLRE